MTKYNTLKTQKKEPKQPKPKATGKSLKFKLPEIKSEKLKRITGVALMASGIFLLISFVSYLANWKIDQDKVDQQTFFEFVFGSDDIIIHNWMGKFGAFVAHQFIHNWFGIASFLIALFLVLISIKLLFNKSVFPLWKSFQVVVFGCFWLPFMFGYFVSSPNDYLPGAFGYGINDWVSSALGSVGAFVSVLFTLALGVTAIFNPPYDELVDKLGVLFDKRTSDDEEEEFEENETEKVNSFVKPEDDFDDSTDVPEEYITYERKTIEPSPTLEMELENENIDVEETPISEIQLEEETLSIETPEKTLETLNTNDDAFSVEIAKDEAILSEDELNTKLQEFGEYDPKLELSTYELPPIDMLVELWWR
jgi:DNA segregation ATPase FtsK/SpoIIIE, S-DNA-T family